MQFRIEQIAINPPNPALAEKLLRDMGAATWSKDHVVAQGKVFGKAHRNAANLAFNYDLFNPEKGEFEILNYTYGENWMNAPDRGHSVSHLGMHCTAEELVAWRKFFAEREIAVAQEVFTESHTNFVIAGKRWYNYVIFDTKRILGVDLKFIVRLPKSGVPNEQV